jgi:hypothetical protein
MQKTNVFKFLLFVAMLHIANVFAQQEINPTSAETVDALLHAENRSVYEREAPPRQTIKKSVEMSVQSIYGASSNLRTDILIGDTLYAGLSIGDKVSSYEIGGIEGSCVLLYPARSARERARTTLALASLSSDEELLPKTKLKGKLTQLCWVPPPPKPITTTGQPQGFTAPFVVPSISSTPR